MPRTSPCVLLVIWMAMASLVWAVDRADRSGDQAQILSRLDGKTVARWGGAQYLFTAKLDRVIAGPVAKSFPPIYSYRLEFTIDEVLRGALKKGQTLTLAHSARQHQPPTFPQGKLCLVVAAKRRGQMLATSVVEADADTVAAARLVCRLPLGWKVEHRRLISPWASLGEDAWPAGQKVIGALACAKTGRPALLAGPGVNLEVEPVPPAKKIKWTNPDGDGQYKITVTNTTDRPIKVRPLISDGRKILWKQSLVILCQDKVYLVPGAGPIKGRVEPAVLGPGKSVSTVVNVLALEGPTWPRGGYRIEFQFCLGELSNVQSLYYMSRHHDKLREKAQAE